MALLPDAEHMDIIEEICLSAFETGTPNTAFALIEKISYHTNKRAGHFCIPLSYKGSFYDQSFASALSSSSL